MDLILVVVEAPTPEQSAFASRALAEALSKKPALFRSVEEEGGGPFFARIVSFSCRWISSKAPCQK